MVEDLPQAVSNKTGSSPSQLLPPYFLYRRYIGIVTTVRLLLGYEENPKPIMTRINTNSSLLIRYTCIEMFPDSFD
jgi:hypothetical protein